MPLYIYTNRISRLLEGHLGINKEENQTVIDNVKAWLQCEWYLCNLDTQDYCFLRDEVVDATARKIIENL